MSQELTCSIVLYNNNVQDVKSLISYLINDTCVKKIYIIDNSSSWGFDYSNYFGEKVDYTRRGSNLGFGKAHNIGIRKALDENVNYHLVLNPDISFVKENSLTELCDYMSINKDIGQLMPKIKYPNLEIQYLCKLLPTPLDLIIRRFFPFQWLINNRKNKYELRFTDYNHVMQVPALSGCFMFLRTSILREVGGFDDRYFMYLEDFDLTRRISLVSKTIYYPKVEVLHNYEKGSYRNFRLLFFHIQSAFKYFNKWGWLNDKQRRHINRKTLKKLGYKKSQAIKDVTNSD